MADGTKDTIYVDVDDEITGIIEKLKTSKHKIVALVLPKRAAMLQSTVNMRLLKRAAKQANKNVVLITSDHNLLPLAGSVGLHVAKSLSSKPAIPPLPKVDDQPETITAEGEEALDKSKSVGELALAPNKEEDETIEVDNEDLAAAGAAADAAVVHASKKNKKLKIPNFEKFRLKFFLIGLAVLLLIGGWVWAYTIAPKAKITIKTDTTTAAVSLDFTAKTDDTTLDLTNSVVPAQNQSSKKSDSEKVPATGQKNIGSKATGTMTLKNCSATDGAITIPAGTAVSSGSYVFLTNDSVTLPASIFSGGGACLTTTNDVNVTAKDSGGAYNLSARSYSVSGYSGVQASGSNMTGGTDNIVKVVSDADVDAAKQKIAARTANVADDLRNTLSTNGYLGLSDTLTNDPPTVTASPKVGDQAAETTVTVETNYSMVGLKRDDLSKLIEGAVNKQIDSGNQAMLDAGIKDAIFRVTQKVSATELKVSIQTVATVGPKIDQEALKKEIKGKKKGITEGIITRRPGVKEVQIDYSPFWVFNTPKNTKKITIIIQASNGQ